MSEKLQADFLRWRKDPRKFVREIFGVTPDPWQDDVLEAFPHKQRIAMLASKGPGKLLGFSVVVETPSGPRRWGDLQVGDDLFAVDGSWTKILGRFDHGVKKIYRVTFDDGSSTRAGAEHLWMVRGAAERARKAYREGRDEMWVVLSTEEIIRRGVRNKNGRWAGRQFEIPHHGAAQFPSSSTQTIDPYLAGVWIGDGSRGSATYTKPYTEVENEIRRRGYATKRLPDGKTVKIRNAKAAFELLECFHCRSPERYIPDNYKYASVQQRTDLLCGLMDTDGCIGSDGHMEYSTTSERLANDVVWMTRSLGGVAFIKEGIKEGWYRNDEGERVDCRDCYRVTVRTPFNPFRIAHKAERWMDPMRNKSTSRYLTRYIDKIEEDGEEEAMCVTVDHPSHCYLANDFIVTHNTAVEAWLTWNFMLTRPTPKIAVTAIDGNNLSANLWTELALWRDRAPILKAFFNQSKTKIEAKHKPDIWWCQARTWPKKADRNEQANTLAGLHAEYIMFVLDESGAMPESLLASAENALSTCIEGHILQAGNPTHLEGPLYLAHKNRDKWFVVQVNGDPDNPKRSPRVSIEWAREQIALYGRDNPWVKINVFGEFPQTSINALIGPEEIRDAQRRFYQVHDLTGFAKIMGIDVARMGGDASVIARRQGRQMFNLLRYRALDNTQGGNIANRVWGEFDADAAFIDGTGGFGMGWHDKLKELGRGSIPVMFNGKATMDLRYGNKRAEMYFAFVEWIKNGGGALPPEGSEGAFELAKALAETTYTFKGEKMVLEEKDQIRQKLGFSPDEADACALTFAEPVTINRRQTYARSRSAVDPGYSPYNDMALGMTPSGPYSPYNF